ncbi:hypothetical protein MACK_000793 [Theileria orientalis]|uniref:EGF-like domain-containing protein n=1 Tax=Theileria orientalis TaxID=68886 RepID=A0A976MCP7_THEOR|nr:hypothetical protein MACK_000793 [Theileria orientalis]
MKLLLFLIFNIYIISVNGYFYTLLPLAVTRDNDNYKAFCPWNQTKDPHLKCTVNKSVMGYFHLESGQVKDAHPEPKDFFNPALQKRFTGDHCKKLKDSWNESKTGAVCKKYSFCYNVAEDKSLCTCQKGFFGNPYEGCHQHCVTDDDCSSPLARCAEPQVANQLKRCVCKDGYDGDGVLCHKNVCGTDRRAKCGGTASHKVCVPTGSGPNDFACICETGYFLNHKKECVPEFTVKENTVITLVGKNIKDGSRIELGDCLSFVINDQTKSIFYHKNSGDSIYVKKNIKNDKQFSIFFIVTKEVTAFSLLREGGFGLTKLYSMTNTFLGCKFGNARIFDPEGLDLSEEDSLDVAHQNVPPEPAPQSTPSPTEPGAGTPGGPAGSDQAPRAEGESGSQPGHEGVGDVGAGQRTGVAGRPEPGSAVTESSTGVSTLQKESSEDQVPDTESETKILQQPREGTDTESETKILTSPQDSNTQQETQNTNGERQPGDSSVQSTDSDEARLNQVQSQAGGKQTDAESAKQDEKLRPSVEVYVRELTAAEKSGGLAGHPLPTAMVQIASQEEPVGLEVGYSRAKGHQDASHLQMSISPETARRMDL